MLPATPATVAEVYRVDHARRLVRPLFACGVAAGFPSPADDYIDRGLDLNELLVQHPAATFFVRVAGDSMTGAGIHDQDILVVDRSLAAASGRIVIAIVNGELTVKRLLCRGNTLQLVAEHPDYPPLAVTEEMGFEVWGVVTAAIHRL